MRKQKLIVSASDYNQLQRLIELARRDRQDSADLAALEQELNRATIMEDAEVPRSVVTMNSTVWFRDLDTEEIERYTLVYPHEADLDENRISVFAPIGTALLGYRERDVVSWHVPSGRRRLEITKVDQPQTAATPPPVAASA